MLYNIKQYLSRNELDSLINVSYRSLSCRTRDELELLILDLHNIFDFKYTCYGESNIKEIFQIAKHDLRIDLYNISYPHDFLELYFKDKYYATDVSFRELITKQTPVDCLAVIKKHNPDYMSWVKTHYFAASNTWMHGTLDVSTSNMIGFSFIGPTTQNSPRVLSVLEYIVPFYAESFRRIPFPKKRLRSNLTQKEIEVLKWLKEGKSSWEISILMNCSKRTVDFHVENAKRKLNAITRAQAVATALHCGVIAF